MFDGRPRRLPARAAARGDYENALADLKWLPAHPNEVRRDVALNSRCWIRARLGIEIRGAWSLYGRGLTRTRMGDAARGKLDLAAARKAHPDIDLAVQRAGLTAETAPNT
jgi:hypothetical protein